MCYNPGLAYCIWLLFWSFSFSTLCYVDMVSILIYVNSIFIFEIWKYMTFSSLQLMDLSPLLKCSLTNFFPGTIWPEVFWFLTIYACELSNIPLCLHNLVYYSIFISFLQVSILLSLQVCISCLASTSIYWSKFKIMIIFIHTESQG